MSAGSLDSLSAVCDDAARFHRAKGNARSMRESDGPGLGFELAAILGLVEGLLTEFLPVSSTGHLIIVGHLMGFTGAMADTAEVAIQLGAILAIMVYERRKIASLLSQAATEQAELLTPPTETCWKWILAKTWTGAS